MIKKGKKLMKQRFDDQIIAQYGIELVIDKYQRELYKENIAIVVGNCEGQILSTKVLGTNPNYLQKAKERFNEIIKHQKAVNVSEGREYKASLIQDGVVISTYADEAYWGEVLSENAFKFINVMVKVDTQKNII